jgi:hypothetical protein
LVELRTIVALPHIPYRDLLIARPRNVPTTNAPAPRRRPLPCRPAPPPWWSPRPPASLLAWPALPPASPPAPPSSASRSADPSEHRCPYPCKSLQPSVSSPAIASLDWASHRSCSNTGLRAHMLCRDRLTTRYRQRSAVLSRRPSSTTRQRRSVDSEANNGRLPLDEREQMSGARVASVRGTRVAKTSTLLRGRTSRRVLSALRPSERLTLTRDDPLDSGHRFDCPISLS